MFFLKKCSKCFTVHKYMRVVQHFKSATKMKQRIWMAAKYLRDKTQLKSVKQHQRGKKIHKELRKKKGTTSTRI